MYDEYKTWAEEVLARIAAKMEKVSVRSADKIPYTTKDGVHDDWSGDDRIGWWTNGFWGGMMWQMYELTGRERYKEIAESVERKHRAAVSACRMAVWANRGSFVSSLAQYRSGRFIMQSMIAQPRRSGPLSPRSFHARINCPA